MKKQKLIYIFFIFSILIFILSFVPSVSRKGHRKIERTVLLKEKDLENFCYIEIEKGGKRISLERKSVSGNEAFRASEQGSLDLGESTSGGQGSLDSGGSSSCAEGFFWEGKSSDLTESFFCDRKTLETLKNSLKKVVKLYKISYKSTGLEDFFLGNNQKLSVKYLLSDGTEEVFYIGGSDFSGNERYYLFPDKKGVYKGEFFLNELFHLESRWWCDPYLIPEETGFSYLQKDIQLIDVKTSDGKTKHLVPHGESLPDEKLKELLSLRHGNLFSIENEEEKFFSESNNLSQEKIMENSTASDTKNPLLSLKVEYSKGFYVYIDFYKNSDDNVTVYYSGFMRDDYQVKTSISNWTFNTLKTLCNCE